MSMGPVSSAGNIPSSPPPIRDTGVGRTEKQEKASDRDGDGRRMWEGRHEEQGQAASDEPAAEAAASEEPKSKDPTGASGGQLDPSG